MAAYLQPITLDRFLIMLAVTAINGAFYAYFAAIILEQKCTLKLFAKCALFSLITISLPNFFFRIDPRVRMPITCGIYLLFSRIICKKRGFDMFKTGLLLIAPILLADAFTGIVVAAIPGLGMQEMPADDQFAAPTSITANLIVAAFALFFISLFRLILKKQNPKSQKEDRRIFHFIRPILLVCCVAALLFLALRKENEASFDQRFQAFLPEYIVIIMLVLLGITYVNQDTRYLRKSRQNDLLMQQQEIQDVLLQETRVFRHNIANLLYGFQGMLLSGDKDAIQDYYDHMVETCAIINNENVLALRRIPNMPLRTLLVNKLQLAGELRIPFYLFVDEGLRYRGIQDIKMCEMLGILLDNAIEAAKESHAPLVSLEIHNAENDMEIVIRNTYADFSDTALAAGSFFPSLTPSKKDHQGIGLTHVRDMTSREKDLLLNIFYQGRFVVASMLLS